MNALDPTAVELRGIHLVEASAGTGKTHAITTLVLRGVLEAGLEIGRMLVVTFTNAATAELRARVRARLVEAVAAFDDPQLAVDTDLRAIVERRRAAGAAATDRQRLLAALYGFDDAAIFTIHGFCQRVLQEFAFESGVRFDTELLGDVRAMLVDVLRDFRAQQLYAAPPELLAGLENPKLNAARLTAIAQQFVRHPRLHVLHAPPADAVGDAARQAARALVQAVGPYALDALERRKRAANAQFFDDLLQRLGAALTQPSGDLAGVLRRRYPLALIDEFQDTDPVQFEIFASIYGSAGVEAGLFLIGDAKQAIYAFRGADVFAYFAAQALAGAQHTLLTNWRSGPALIRAVNAVFDAQQDAFVLPQMRFAAARPAPPNRDALGAGAAPLRILLAERGVFPEHQKAPHQLNKPQQAAHCFFAALADAIVELFDGLTRIDGRAVRPGDVALLSRTNRQLHLVQAALRGAGVPSVVLGDASVFESSEAVMLERILRALAMPGDARAVRAALATPLLGRNGDDLEALQRDETAWEAAVEAFQHWSARWRSGGFTSAFRALLDAEDVPARLLAQPGGERVLTNVLHLGELLQQAAGSERRGPLALVEWLRRMRLDGTARGEQASEAAQIRLESDVRALKLTTVHKSKGLEYPVVICPFLWDVRAKIDLHEPPLFHQAQHLALDLGWPAHQTSCAAQQVEALGEETRLAYVALTRAQHLAIVVWGAFTGFERSALARLWHGAPRRGGTAEQIRAATRVLSDVDLRADLAAYASRAAGAVSIEALAAPRRQRYSPPPEPASELVAPPRLPPLRQPWRVSSFTALAAGGELLGARAEEGLDRDEAAAIELSAPAGLDGFPRGRRPGTLVHAVFERIDFQHADAAALAVVVRELLTTFRIDPAHADGLCGGIAAVLETPLDTAQPPLRLRDVAPAQRLNEMEFAFPVGLDAGGAPRAGLTPPRLATLLARHARGAAAQAYAQRVTQLPFQALAGYLRGFIDLVFRHAGRWYVVDYKSNDLGGRAADYLPAPLAAAMAQHDYYLQALLYAVAVHRYLAQRLAGYDYERDFGGIYYLFVRGMAPARGASTGVVFERPTRALIEALDALLRGGNDEAWA